MENSVVRAFSLLLFPNLAATMDTDEYAQHFLLELLDRISWF
jgi:hypothetical protein